MTSIDTAAFDFFQMKTPLSESQIVNLLSLKRFEKPPEQFLQKFLQEFHRRNHTAGHAFEKSDDQRSEAVRNRR